MSTDRLRPCSQAPVAAGSAGGSDSARGGTGDSASGGVTGGANGGSI